MKIDNLTLQYMTNDIKVIIKHYKLDVKQLDVNDMNNIWFHTYCNRTYLDNNPNVIKVNGNRLLSYISRDKYDLYPCNTNDTTIYTGLKQILINLQK